MIENEEMGKEIERFEKDIKECDTKRILYKQDSDIEGIVRKEFLVEKYGETLFQEITESQKISISDLANQEIFLKFCEIADSNI